MPWRQFAELTEPDAEFEEITEGEELKRRVRLKPKWVALVTADLGAQVAEIQPEGSCPVKRGVKPGTSGTAYTLQE